MGKIFYILGKSASGKDSIYQKLQKKEELKLYDVNGFLMETQENRGQLKDLEEKRDTASGQLAETEQSLEKAKQEAITLAIEAGAVESSVEIIEMEDVPLAYYPGNTNRVKIKAAGDLHA